MASPLDSSPEEDLAPLVLDSFLPLVEESLELDSEPSELEPPPSLYQGTWPYGWPGKWPMLGQ